MVLHSSGLADASVGLAGSSDLMPATLAVLSSLIWDYTDFVKDLADSLLQVVTNADTADTVEPAGLERTTVDQGEWNAHQSGTKAGRVDIHADQSKAPADISPGTRVQNARNFRMKNRHPSVLYHMVSNWNWPATPRALLVPPP